MKGCTVMEYITTEEAAQQWGIAQYEIQVLCRLKLIKGVVKTGGRWQIPKNSEKPEIRKFRLRSILTILVAFIPIASFCITHFFGGSIKPIEIEFYDVVQFSSSGEVTELADFEGKVSSKADGNYNYAFTSISFITNPKSEAVRVQENYLHIEGVTPVEESVLRFEVVTTNDKVIIYALNNGWGNSGPITSKVTLTPIYPSIDYDSGKVLKEKNVLSNYTLDTGDFLAVAYWDISHDELILLANSSTSLTIRITLEYSINGETFTAINGTLIRLGLGLVFDPGGADPHTGDIDVSIFLPLDIGKCEPNQNIKFIKPEYTPKINNSVRFDTTIVPNQSCILSYNLVYRIGGKKYETPSHTATVTVPVFNEIEIDEEHASIKSLVNYLAKHNYYSINNVDYNELSIFLYDNKTFCEYIEEKANEAQ